MGWAELWYQERSELVKGPGEGLPWDGTEDSSELEARKRSGLFLGQVQSCPLLSVQTINLCT